MVTKTKKELAELWLRDVPQDKVFWFHGGRMAKNLDELSTTLREMPEETFQYHATGGKKRFQQLGRGCHRRRNSGQSIAEGHHPGNRCSQGGDEAKLAQGKTIIDCYCVSVTFKW